MFTNLSFKPTRRVKSILFPSKPYELYRPAIYILASTKELGSAPLALAIFVREPFQDCLVLKRYFPRDIYLSATKLEPTTSFTVTLASLGLNLPET